MLYSNFEMNRVQFSKETRGQSAELEIRLMTQISLELRTRYMAIMYTHIYVYINIYIQMFIDQSIGRQGNNKKAKQTKTKALQNQMAKSMHFSKPKQNNVYTILITKKKTNISDKFY